MEKINIRKIEKESRRNFKKAWVESAKLIPRGTTVEISREGKLHPFREMIQKCREVLSNQGFIEMENRTLLPEGDVYKQYGPETPAILDRAFYVAKLPRPEVGLSNEKLETIQEILGKPIDKEQFSTLLREYKKGNVEGDDLVEEIVNISGGTTAQATEIMDRAIPELKNLEPIPTKMTFRSHMTGTWYHTLAAVKDKMSLPISLFSVGPRYRNEQKEDAGHLRVHNSASLVIMDPNMSLEAGEKIVDRVLKEFGFSDVKYEKKKGTSNYYADGLEKEIFAKLDDDWLEIGDIGMYSLISLANFGIEYPVFNAGFGVERLAMVLGGYKDIRDLVFPQFRDISYDDESIKGLLERNRSPKTPQGKRIASGIEKAVRENRNAIAPCNFVAYEDEKLRVEVYEKEEGKKLVGPATFNEIYVEDGNILSQEESGEKSAVDNYLSAISDKMGSEIERDFVNKNEGEYHVKIVKGLPDVNITMPKSLKEYLTGNYKKVLIKGPIFLNVKYKSNI